MLRVNWHRGFTSKVLIIVGSCCGMAAVLAVALAVGWIFQNRQSEPLARALDKLLMEDIASGRVESAYSRMSSGLKSRMTIEELRTLIASNAALKWLSDSSLESPDKSSHYFRQETNIRYIAGHSMRNGKDSISCNFTIVKEGAVWVVDNLEIVPGQGSSNP
jgi:hypothetical protein